MQVAVDRLRRQIALVVQAPERHERQLDDTPIGGAGRRAGRQRLEGVDRLLQIALRNVHGAGDVLGLEVVRGASRHLRQQRQRVVVLAAVLGVLAADVDRRRATAGGRQLRQRADARVDAVVLVEQDGELDQTLERGLVVLAGRAGLVDHAREVRARRRQVALLIERLGQVEQPDVDASGAARRDDLVQQHRRLVVVADAERDLRFEQPRHADLRRQRRLVRRRDGRQRRHLLLERLEPGRGVAPGVGQRRRRRERRGGAQQQRRQATRAPERASRACDSCSHGLRLPGS
jgi:hypothetical protein